MITKEQIVSVVCEVCDVSQSQLFAPGRLTKNVRARQLCWYLFRDLLNISSTFTAIYFKKDHTTVLSGLKRFDLELEHSDEAREHYSRALMMLADSNKKAA